MTHDANRPGDAGRSGDDITDRQRTEEALHASLQLIETIVNSIPARVFWKDTNLVYLGCNRQFARDAGFADPQDIIGKDDYEMVWRDQADAYRGDDRHVIESGNPKLQIEEPQTTPCGNTIALLTSKVPLRRSDGAVIGVLGTYTDITERKRGEEAVLASELRYRRLFESARDGILILDAETGAVVDVNPFLVELLGFPREAIIGSKVWDLGFIRDIIANQDSFAELQREEYVRYDDKPLESSDGRRIDVEFVSNVYLVNGHKVIQCNIRDITVRRKAEADQATLEAQLQQAQKMESVGRLAGGVAHDFNNMLGVILGHVDLALEQVDPARSLHADLQKIRKAAMRSANLTRQLLAFARKQTVTPKVLDVNTTVASMLEMLKRLIGENIDLTWRPAADVWAIEADPSQIDQILANLCVNARDAISGVGKLTIETGNSTIDEHYCAIHAGCVPGEYVRFAVSDTGCGMDKETQAHLFEPFFTTKPTGEGTGLGLAMVYGAVKQNRGFINVYSEPNHGTTFTVYLPRHLGPAVQVQADGAAKPALRGHETILLVEDEPLILTLTTRMLELRGYTVLAAGTPGQAMRVTREHVGGIHLLITDVVMPEMNGRVLAKNLLLLYPSLKRLFMSGYTADVIAHHGVLEEGVQFLQKPFSAEDLAAKVRDVLDAEP
ncbi:MAG: PAS domain S-box protein [Vicinamibacterales bacterium]|nr:PAS domain S-box protein [Vicinamibacterales bacterium]